MFMNLQLALIPNKHLRIDESILGLAGYCLTLLDKPMSPDELLAHLHSNNSKWSFKPNMDYVLLALDTLYAIKQITPVSDNRVHRRVKDK